MTTIARLMALAALATLAVQPVRAETITSKTFSYFSVGGRTAADERAGWAPESPGGFGRPEGAAEPPSSAMTSSSGRRRPAYTSFNNPNSMRKRGCVACCSSR